MSSIIEYVRKIVRKKPIYYLWRVYCIIYNKIYTDKKHGLKKKCFGKLNSDKTFYVLRCDHENWGLYNICFDFMLQCEWAKKKGFIPIVDLKNYRPALLDDENGNRDDNLWDKMFLQPAEGIPLNEVYRSRNVLLGWKNGLFYKTLTEAPDWNDIATVKNGVKRWGKLFNEYIKLCPVLQEQVDLFCKEHFIHKNVLGVSIREGYRYAAMIKESVINEHPAMLAPEDSIDLVKQYMDKWNYEYIFVICDDEECVQKFKSAFGSKCIKYDRPRSVFFKNGKPVLDKTVVHAKYQSFYERNRDYLIEVELLARCDSIWGGLSSGTEAALFRNNGKYRYVEIYDRGKYEMR